MSEPLKNDLDPAAFRSVWQRVMPADRPDCPFTLDVPAPASPAPVPRSAVCLGEDSAGEMPALLGALARTARGREIYRAMARRQRRAGGLPAVLAKAKESQFRRLSTACFLITGERPAPDLGEAEEPLPLALALRARYRAEQELALTLLSAAAAAADPCLAQLYRDLGVENQTHAGMIREFLERM